MQGLFSNKYKASSIAKADMNNFTSSTKLDKAEFLIVKLEGARPRYIRSEPNILFSSLTGVNDIILSSVPFKNKGHCILRSRLQHEPMHLMTQLQLIVVLSDQNHLCESQHMEM